MNHAHDLGHLFAQLGLASDPEGIERFIAEHRPLSSAVALYRAPFWSAAQRAFLKEEILDDAEWAAAIDDLNARLH